MKILVIEDDYEVRHFIVKGFREHGHCVDETADGKEGLFLATSESYEAMIIDRLLPGVDGLTIIQTIRGAGNQTPVLVLSALGEVDDRVRGLKAGGDDYLVKPFAFEELLARTEALLRRQQYNSQSGQDNQLVCGDIVLDLLSREVTRSGRRISLLTREYKLLEYLVRHQGQVVTRTMLLENVWDYHFDPQTNVIDVHISRMRQKLNEGFDTDPVVTVRGAGYMIKVQEDR